MNSINFLKFNTSEALHYLSLFNNGFYYLRHILNSILTLKCDLLTFFTLSCTGLPDRSQGRGVLYSLDLPSLGQANTPSTG